MFHFIYYTHKIFFYASFYLPRNSNELNTKQQSPAQSQHNLHIRTKKNSCDVTVLTDNSFISENIDISFVLSTPLPL